MLQPDDPTPTLQSPDDPGGVVHEFATEIVKLARKLPPPSPPPPTFPPNVPVNSPQRPALAAREGGLPLGSPHTSSTAAPQAAEAEIDEVRPYGRLSHPLVRLLHASI